MRSAKNDNNSDKLLYQIAKAMATVRDGHELLKMVVEYTKPVFGFHDIGLSVADKNHEFYLDWSVAYQELSPTEINEELFRENKTGLPYDDPLLAHTRQRCELEQKPFRMTIDEISEVGFSDFTNYEALKEFGYQHFLVTTLKHGGETIGIFNFNSKEANCFDDCDLELFQAIADLVAAAVVNINAKEEILARSREKDVLLSINQSIAAIQNYEQLLKVIFDKIKPIFGFHDIGLFVITNEGKDVIDWAVAYPNISPSVGNDYLHAEALATISYIGSPMQVITERVEAKNLPIILTYAQFVEMMPDNLPEKEVFKSGIGQFGYAEFMGTALKTGGKVIGLLVFNSKQKKYFSSTQFKLFQAVADQVAVAVANILANQEIKNNLLEIEELKKRLEAENVYLTEEVAKNYNYQEIIGNSLSLHRVFEIIEQVAPTDATVLIQGETGTGKELVARAVHNRSERSCRPLIKLNCAALPRELVESELFGHERGSFTGAHERRIGKFELADQGTIFLDEIGELPLEMQVKLLRVLQEKEIERVGGKGTIKLDLRVIAATNRNLAQEVQAARFRADLYYRLCSVELFMPTLRERKEDLEALTLYFAKKYAAKFSRKISGISARMLAELHNYDFPGNVRELEHIVEHAVIFSRNETLILPRTLKNSAPGEPIYSPSTTNSTATQTLQDVEREHILQVLQQTNGKIKGKNGAAEILGLNPSTLYFKMKKYSIQKNS
jgi:transcriptional regulator with GAF, ATPase, and Fis domain